MAKNDLKKGLNEFYKRIIAIEGKMSNEINDSLKRITTELKGSNYILTRKVQKKIKKEFATIEKKTGILFNELQDDMKDIVTTSVASASAKAGQMAVVRKIVDKIKLDDLSTNIHDGLEVTRLQLLKQLKKSIAAGESAVNTARKLLKIEDPKVILPGYIKDITRAARNAITDPKEFSVFQGVLDKYKRRINNLTRAGEVGFGHLGIRRGSRAFTRQIKKLVKEMQGLPDDIRLANLKNIDGIVNGWAARKALIIHQRVARTEGSRAYHKYTMEYAREADHIVGIRVLLSGSHPDNDICDPQAIDYYFVDGEPDLPPFHPNCLCYTQYIFSEEFLNEEREAA